MTTRIERDSLGELEVPLEAYYGVHTCRSLRNFNAAGEPVPLEMIHGMVKLKWACAQANHALDLLPKNKLEAIATACQRILAGEFTDQFPVDCFQAGSGTSSNMNVNEVVANIANEVLGGQRGDRGLVHPNDDVNKGQSTNNIFPSGIRVAGIDLTDALLPALKHLIAELQKKGGEYADVIRSGRTHLQDAVPETMGQAFHAWAHALVKDVRRIEAARDRLLEIGAGGNAIGTGINTKKAFRPEIAKAMHRITGKSYRVAENGIEITQFLTDMADMSSALRLTAMDIAKLCNDLRLLVSGPNTGFAEVQLPAVEPGSSIMPGKINPSICEAANMACLQVMGNDHAVQLAANAGQLELNTHMPVTGLNLVKSFRILTRTAMMLADKCISGILVNRERCYYYFENSGGLGTVLNPVLGYDKVAALVKESLKSKKTAREIVIEKGIMTGEAFDELVKHCTGPNLD
ncbi:MAG TPA: aspartate ammonia-lyase [Kiritimatiellia bacterium]|nr:aspartate ammonia-lyase [Kiritimatiellia bacterium]HMO99702.1 aspartate ammonia-lyase [Kiritimatiellia bacterium]HMP97046.1 aspartate ammonia-lyase [Kiritimatiellia bacterium]